MRGHKKRSESPGIPSSALRILCGGLDLSWRASGETIRQRTSGGSVAAKYRQHGYQDRDEKPRHGSGEKSGPAPPKKDNTFGPKPVNLPGTRAISRCTQCGTVLQGMPPSGQCPKCGFELHSCKQCAYFDPGSRFECMQPITERIPRKDARNECNFYEMRFCVGRKRISLTNDCGACVTSIATT